MSVIVPIYNVKNFISRGINQLLRQTYRCFEIILVDDGSTDGSYEECVNWASTNNSIRVLHQKNMGAGSARNLGLENAKGSLIYFFDIDDKIAPNLLEYNAHLMSETSSEIIVFGYNTIDTTYNVTVSVEFPHTIINNNAELREIYVNEFVLKVNGFTWNKFYRKDFLDKYNLRFENQRIQQDEVFNLLCYKYVEKMYISSEVLYSYYVYDKGNTRSRYIEDRFEIYKSVRLHFEELKKQWNLDDKRLDDYLAKRFYVSAMSCITFNLLHPNCTLTNRQKKAELERIMNDKLTLEAFTYADSNNLGLEQFIYRNACRSKKLQQLKAFVCLFSFMRKWYSKIRRKIC